MRSTSSFWPLVVGFSMVVASAAEAQPLGTFTWQLEPFCNRVTVSVTQNGGIYTLDGYDDQCGSAQRAPLVGLATPNPDGTIGFGLHIVTVPGGKSVHVDARMSLATFGGPWTDSAGNSGTLVLNGAAAGAARPVPSGAPAWGAVIQAPSASSGQGLVLSRPNANTFTPPAIAVQFGPPSTLALLGGAGVYVTSRAGVSVLGVSDSAIGVGGITATGTGVSGSSLGTGVGVRAIGNGTDGAALDVRDGALRVSGTTRPVFQHTAIGGAGGNINGNLTRIDHPLLNGDPTAMVFVEHVYGAGVNVYVPGGVGVYYDTTVDQWSIFREDTLNMPASARFNVLVIKQ